MKNDSRKKLLFAILSSIILLSGWSAVYGQAGELRTLTGRIRWKKSMGVLASMPRGIYPANNICAQFFVVVTQPSTGSLKPIQYDIALEAKPEPSKPDYYSCVFEMKVPSNVGLTVYPGMGDGLAWPDTKKSPFHYTGYWIGETPRIHAERAFTPAKKEVTLGNKGMYLSFELGHAQ